MPPSARFAMATGSFGSGIAAPSRGASNSESTDMGTAGEYYELLFEDAEDRRRVSACAGPAPGLWQDRTETRRLASHAAEANVFEDRRCRVRHGDSRDLGAARRSGRGLGPEDRRRVPATVGDGAKRLVGYGVVARVCGRRGRREARGHRAQGSEARGL